MTVKFNNESPVLLTQIVGRWRRFLIKRNQDADPIDVEMDICAADGVNGNPRLDLGKLMEFDDFNFVHDMVGIERNINRKTGSIEGGFLPRCATK